MYMYVQFLLIYMYQIPKIHTHYLMLHQQRLTLGLKEYRFILFLNTFSAIKLFQAHTDRFNRSVPA